VTCGEQSRLEKAQKAGDFETAAKISAVRRPWNCRATISGANVMPTRLKAEASTTLAIGSLSTRTPLQSKMTTGPSDAPANVRRAGYLFSESRGEDIVGPR
jgi:hypothetical protein